MKKESLTDLCMFNTPGRHVLSWWLICVPVLLLLTSPAHADMVTGSRDVSGSGYTPSYAHDGNIYGPYGWDFSHTISFDGSKVEKDAQIEFTFDPNTAMTPEEQTSWKNNVEAAIEGQWNDRYLIRDNDTGSTYPLRVDVTYDDPFDQTVTVWKDGEGPGTNMLNWHVGDSGLCNSHEFGHMLGLYDEWWGGAVNPIPNPLIDDYSLMGSITGNPTMPSRYYQQFLDYVQELNPDSNLVLIPEPVVLTLLAIGGLALLRRRRAGLSQPKERSMGSREPTILVQRAFVH